VHFSLTFTELRKGETLVGAGVAHSVYKGVSKSFRTDRLGRELQMVQLTTARCSCIASQRVFVVVVVVVVVVVYFDIDSVRKLLDTLS
jgi:hypothetical protein